MLIFSLVFAVALTSCTKENPLVKDYPNLNKASNITTINGQKLVEKIQNNDSFVVVLGFSACPWCQAIMPVISDVCDRLSYKNIYYCDIKDMRDNDDSIDKKYYEFLYEYAYSARDVEKDRINAPTTLAIKDGKIEEFLLNTVSSHVKDDTNTLPPLNDEQLSELATILENLIKKTF